MDKDEKKFKLCQLGHDTKITLYHHLVMLTSEDQQSSAENSNLK
jgi:hypothetical protein